VEWKNLDKKRIIYSLLIFVISLYVITLSLFLIILSIWYFTFNYLFCLNFRNFEHSLIVMDKLMIEYLNCLVLNSEKYKNISIRNRSSVTAYYGYKPDNNLQIPMHELKETKQMVGGTGTITKLNLHIDDESPSDNSTYKSVTVKDKTLEFRGVEKVNFLHDYTFEFLESKTDFLLSNWVKLNDLSSDDLTPDSYKKINKKHIFIEFTTNKSNYFKNMAKDLDIKQHKYLDPLEARINRLNMIERNNNDELSSVYLYIINVSSDLVVSNLQDLPRSIINELVMRFRLGLQIEAELIDRKLIKSNIEQELDDSMTEVKRFFESLKFKDNFDQEVGKCLEEENIRKFVNTPLNNEKIREIMKGIRSDALEELKESSLFFKLNMEPDNFTDQEKIEINKRANELKCAKEEIQQGYQDFLIKKENYRDEVHSDSSNLRRDRKSIIPIPYINVKNDITSYQSKSRFMDGLTDLPVFSLDIHCASGSVWEKVMYDLQYKPEVTLNENLEEQIDRALNPQYYNDPEVKKTYHRVKVDIDKEDQINLAKVGLFSKRFKDNNEIVNNKLEKKKGFSLDTDTSDIEKFINSFERMFSQNENIANETQRLSLETILDALNLHNPRELSKKLIDFVRIILNTNIGKWMKIISDIACEICVSVKQHTKNQEFIIKKLKDHNIYLLIRTTGQENLISFSLMFPKITTINNLYNDVMPELLSNDQYYWTNFRTVNLDKLNNLCLAESMFINLTVFWFDQYKIDWTVLNEQNLISKKTEKLFPQINEAYRMILFSILCFLEDKKQTEMIMTNIRYVYMEGFVSFPLRPCPQKMIKKLPVYIKSRLSVFVINKTLDAMENIASGNYFYAVTKINEEDKTTIHRSNLFNYITGKSIDDLGLMINIMYIGYLNNKNELMQGNKINSLYNKIISMEEKFTSDVKSSIGFNDPTDVSTLKTHDYSVSMLKYACFLSLRKIEKTKGTKIKEQIESDILRKLGDTKLLKVFGTLKSSSTFDSEKDFDYLISDDLSKLFRDDFGMKKWVEEFNEETINEIKEEKKAKLLDKLNDIPSRTKVLLAAADLLKDNLTFGNLLNSAYHILMDLDRLDIDVFDKAQHGGIREIFILSITARICQFTIETISRVICENFPMEMMTHPKNKESSIIEHKRNVHVKFGKQPSILIATSDDAEKWNQAHFVGKFGQMLCYFTPTYMWPFICNFLDLWFKRNIKIDSRLIKIMEHNEDLIVQDQEFQKLYNMYKGRLPPNNWYPGNKKRFIKIKSGFMQGILHYTSSLFHVVSLETTIFESGKIIDEFLIKIGKNKNYKEITTMVSSDDSSMFMTLPGSSKSEMKQALSIAAICIKLKNLIGKSLGIYLSIKSTQLTLYCMEFNSVFTFSESRYHAYFKQVIAATTISEKESLVSKQEEQSNLITSIVENGGSSVLASICQVSQGLFHYRLLGSSLLPIVPRKLIPGLKELRDPSLGYFLMDNPLMVGIMGFKYNLWNLVMTDRNISALYKYMLDNAIKKEVEETLTSKKITLHTTTTGLFTNAIIIPYGENRKLKKAQDLLGANTTVFEEINKDPIILYKNPKTVEELEIQIKLKLLSPGVSESFSRGEGVARKMAQAVYLVMNKILSESGNYYDTDNKTTSTKTSLIKRLYETISFKKEFINKEILNKDEIQILFPASESYENITSNISLITNYNLTLKTKQLRRVKNTIRVTDGTSYLIPPVQLVSWKWFSKRIKVSKTIAGDLWEKLSKSISWLRPDPYETLINSPFSNHYQIYNFLSRLEHNSRSVHLLGAPISSTSSSVNILTLCCRNIWNGYEIPLVFDIEKKKEYGQFSELKHIIFMIMSSPYDKKTKLDHIKALLNASKFDTLDKGYNDRKAALFLIKQFQDVINKKTIPITEFINLVMKYKYGKIGGFIVPQNYNRSKKRFEGFGIWNGMIGNVSVNININSYVENDTSINYISALFVSKNVLNPNFWAELRDLCKDLKIENINRKILYEPNKKILGHLKNFSLSEMGIPIYYSSDLSLKFDFKEKTHFSLDIKNNNSLKLIYDDGIIKFNLISYLVKSSDYEISVTESRLNHLNVKPFLISWIRNIPIEIEQVNYLIKNAMINEPFLNFDLSDLQSWLRDLFQTSLYNSGVLKKSTKLTSDFLVKEISPFNTPKKTPAEIIDDIDSLLDNINLMDEFALEVDFPIDVENYDESDDMSDVLPWFRSDQEQSLIEIKLESVRQTSYALQKFTENIVKIFGIENLRSFILDNEISRDMDEKFLEILVWLTGKDRSSLKYVDRTITFDDSNDSHEYF
ncbi:RNA-dependent RNA polymerase, partial [coleopteran phenui-related virus 308]